MNKPVIGLMSLALALGLPAVAQAETVVEKVARTGVLTVGTSFDTVPYSYIDANGNLVGYSVDIVNRIKTQLEAELGREITVQRREASSLSDRIPLLTNREIDISCDTQFTWERDRFVDFSISYGLSGIRLLTPEGSTLGTPESLVGQRIGVTQDSLGQQVIGLVQPRAVLVPLASADAMFTALQRGEVAAIAGDSVVLGGLVAQKGGTEVFELAPTVPYQRYGIACMVPQDNSTFLNMVDYAIATLLQSYVSGNQQALTTVNQWIGPGGIVPLPQELITEFFEMVLIQRAQVPPSTP
ncbi:MAG TPA: extracellular substrate binding-like orphan protein GrrP [Leptolyngbyaceae cyanobacterium M65_K2018_010]|nr:extracellular substrate binding-like orphan protein GrrP [Leptolyngbyaceae cyanobacterium M65_K2018_010]